MINQYINSDYFIWRTKLDGKVRLGHLALEGKIFRKDNPPVGFMPGTRYNCRCHSEPVPDYILVKDEIAERKAFELYLRKGIRSRLIDFCT